MDTENWKRYRRKEFSEMRPYVVGENMNGINISDADRNNGSPKIGDMIARNPKNHNDQWLVAQKYFAENFGACIKLSGARKPQASEGSGFSRESESCETVEIGWAPTTYEKRKAKHITKRT